MSDINKKENLLLHVCCIGCGVAISQELQSEFNVTLYFFNPNISPLEEYEKRLKETRRIAKDLHIKLVIGDYDHSGWLEFIKGYEDEPEKGKRCELCYFYRLKETAKVARDSDCKYFTTTLTVSPHKEAAKIIEIGEKNARKYNIKFLARDFKKKDGFKKASKISKELGLYRQNYCGCEFSRRD